MEIRSTQASEPSVSASRIDFTRQNRELINDRQPIPPELEEAEASRDPRTAAQSVKEARDAFRAQRQGRIANARAHYTANHADAFAKQVESARTVYETRVEKLYENRYESTHPTASADSLDLSAASQGLAALDGTASDDQRAARVNELKGLFHRGQLPSDDLVARTAYRLLGGE